MPKDEIRKAIEYIGNESNTNCLAKQLVALANEPMVLDMMEVARRNSKLETGAACSRENMRAALLALAERCRT